MITLKHISHSFSDNYGHENNYVLNDINLMVNPGELISLIGPSGCGKTTLVNIIAGYIQPTHGVVYSNNKIVTAPGKDRIVISQEHDLFNWMTVYQNMSLVSSNYKEIMKCLSLTSLESHINAYPYQLSGGMKKRLSLARALVIGPESSIIMDEPFSSLDYQMRRNLQQVVLDVVKKLGKTVIFVTHDIEEALLLSDKVIVLSKSPCSIIEEINSSIFSSNDVHIKDSIEFLKLKKHIQSKLNTNLLL